MHKQTTRPVSESDRAVLQSYLRLTPANREKVIAYLAALKASQCTPGLSADFPR